MCFKKLWEMITGGNNDVPLTGNKVLLSFAINNYPGTQNDLNGCLNDQKNMIKTLSDFAVRSFKDSEVTKDKFINELDSVISQAKEGDTVVVHYSGHGTYVADVSGDEPDGYDEAVYLYDGALIDDKLGEALDKTPDGVKVIILLDSCFSGTATRVIDENKMSKFVCTERRKLHIRHKKFLKSTSLKWVLISGCSEHQTSADAYINGGYEGAFTHFLLKALDRDYTYKQWFDKLREYLPSDEYDQIPTIEGPEELLDTVVFN
jgi:metacaspase-1